MTDKVSPTDLIDDAKTKAFEARYKAVRRSRIAALMLLLIFLTPGIVFLYRADLYFLFGALFAVFLWMVYDAVKVFRLPREKLIASIEYSRRKLMIIWWVLLMGYLFGGGLLDWLGL